ncbi:hypothetical protein Q2K19_26245 [Micromonospora soli]|uniref:hypothetical protein n=1 Tax=Micromonospora sp. NBRC 110009 TaxID=3061627 RepID=UPI002672C80B|nr:hypothetical protein [Micromonospora sp. NBRC 110009]WKT97644.1 hypothetical protein Q2K19_26245 [Micromonospora sp. NBRC 110009]
MVSTDMTVRNLRHFPVEAQRSAEAAAEERDQRLRAITRKRSSTAAKKSAEASHRLRRLLGDDTWADLRDLMQQERVTLRDLLQPPGGLASSYDRLNKARRRKAKAFLRRRDIRQEAMVAIAADYHEAINEVFAADGNISPGFHLSNNLDKWLSLSPFHDRALPWGVFEPDDSDDPHRWEVFRPPFFGFNFGFVPVRNDNFVVDRIHTLNPSLGDVGISITMDDGDAGDFDYASGDGFSAVAFAFVPPTTGLIEVLIDAQCVQATHRLDTTDEWGWSNSRTGQTNFLMLDVLHPNVSEPSYAEMSTFDEATDDDDHFLQVKLTRGAHYFAQLFSAGPVPAGQSVIVCVGTRSFDSSGTNDVSIHSTSDFRWFISSVEVRISP